MIHEEHKIKDINSMRKILVFIISLACLAMSGSVQAQTWHDAKSGNIHVFGNGWPSSIKNKYQRLPTTMRTKLKVSKVWTNSLLSSGLYVRFRTDAKAISVQYEMTQAATQHYFVSTFGQSGIDLFARSADGKTYHWLAPHVNNATFGSPATAYYGNIIPANMEGETVCEYILYLPSLNGVSSLKVGTTDAETFEWIEVPEENDYIVAYGSGTVQGASASHPGNIWTNRVGRALDIQVLNFGFMGLAKLEAGVFDVLAELNPKAYIIDAMPDMLSTPDVIVERIVAGVNTLRAVRDCPILLVESPGTPDKLIHPATEALHVEANARLKQAYDQLKAEGCRNIFYLSQEEIGLTSDDFLDGTDVNDLGMKRYAEVYLEKLAYIEEHMEGGDAIDEIPSYQSSNDKLYDLGGRQVRDDKQKGIFIQRGKKILR